MKIARELDNVRPLVIFNPRFTTYATSFHLFYPQVVKSSAVEQIERWSLSKTVAA